MSLPITVLALLSAAAVVALTLWFSGGKRRWVPLSWGVGHRHEEVARVTAILHWAGVRYRLRNAVSLGTEATMAAGMITTLLVRREDLQAARRALAQHVARE